MTAPPREAFGLILVALAGVACSGYSDECTCGTDWTASRLSCSARGKCEGAFELVGHEPLRSRGLNAAIALTRTHAYIGARGDGVVHPDSNVLIVDVSSPAQPRVVGELGPPDEGLLGLTSRELRVVPDKNLLVVLNIVCATDPFSMCGQDRNVYPDTGGVAETANLKLYDITDPVRPVLVGRYDFGYHPDVFVDPRNPHEFFLWRDPLLPDRVLLYVTQFAAHPNLVVIDVTDPTAPRLVAEWDTFERTELAEAGADPLHSVGVSDDGRVVYLAHFGAGFFMLDSSTIAASDPSPHLDLLTPVDARVDISPPEWAGFHSAIPVPGRELVLMTNEGYAVDIYNGCPWGWAWMVDVQNPERPRLFVEVSEDGTEERILGQLRLPENDPGRCPPPALQSRIAFSSHNPTATEHLAIVTWYSGGLQVFDITDPARPIQTGAFYPEPLAEVMFEDPLLGGDGVGMWSYPIIQDGLIYVVDVRNGLYVLRYTGPYAEEVSARPFLEGNSNLR